MSAWQLFLCIFPVGNLFELRACMCVCLCVRRYKIWSVEWFEYNIERLTLNGEYSVSIHDSNDFSFPSAANNVQTIQNHSVFHPFDDSLLLSHRSCRSSFFFSFFTSCNSQCIALKICSPYAFYAVYLASFVLWHFSHFFRSFRSKKNGIEQP